VTSLAIPLPFPLNRQDARLMVRFAAKRRPSATAADAELVARLREGDESAFAQLIDT
jgi:hypothetical protein